ncbi:dGTP triphosphohydrolase [Nocardiopsis synnemataformans]|uniref:dGTP triphosphohydrolase n=1 Tax=Nocardiopsis synnemataformans TaxID=61305 RepID=UPI003EBA7219
MNEHDLQRRTPTAGNHDPLEEDYSRVLRSAALRRLGGVSQSLHLEEDATTPRTRLTHSLEVACIAGRIAQRVGAHTRLVETAGLAHDLGHPPFGHYGESVLDSLGQTAGGFEANAQTLRILTRLEPVGHSSGLNLTRATIDATCKYPWPHQEGQRKFGVFPQDAHAFAWARHSAPHGAVSIEAQIMDWADDIANATGDLEDGVRARLLRPRALTENAHRRFLSHLAAECLSTQPAEHIDQAARELLQLQEFAILAKEEDDATPRTREALCALTRTLTTRWVQATTAQGTPVRRHHAHIRVEPRAHAEAAWIKAATLHHVLRPPQRRTHRPHIRQALTHLFEHLHHHPDQLNPSAHHLWHKATTSQDRTRAVLDHIATMTEPQVNSHARTHGL